MALLTRLLPRDWDGRRLLRFLTGLALLALAFTAPAAPAAAPAPAAVSRAAEVPAAETEQAAPVEIQDHEIQDHEIQDQECPRRADHLASVADRTVTLAGVAPGSPDARGPPLG